MKRRSPKFRHILEVIIVVAVIIVLNIAANSKFTRLDLTEDKLHTLSNNTIDLLENDIQQVINIEIYLDGDLPAIVQKLKNSIKEKIEELQAYSGKKIKFRFVDPNEDKELANIFKRKLIDEGLLPTRISTKTDGGSEQLDIWPCAKILYGESQQNVQFLPTGQYIPSQNQIDNAVNQLEYNFIKAFWLLLNPVKDRIAILKGHDELNFQESWVISHELNKFYQVDTTVRIIDSSGNENLRALRDFEAVIIAKPRKPFNEREKYIIDQYVMKGGKVIWLLDMLEVPEDSLSIVNIVNTYQYDLNLDDMLFKYGVRLNKNLISDDQCAPNYRRDNNTVIPKWYHYPKIKGYNENDLTKNVYPVKVRYGSSIETIGNIEIKKTALLQTSESYKVMGPRFRVSYDYNDHGYRPIDSLRTDTAKRKTLAILLEGEFTSLYKGRIINKFINSPDAHFKEKGVHSNMAIISDGDLIRNELVRDDRGVLHPIGLEFDQVIRDPNGQFIAQYGNSIFFLNLVDKMLGHENFITLRSRTKFDRLLDKQDASINRRYWQTFNLTIPVTLVVLLGFVQWFIRRRKFSINQPLSKH